MRGPEVRLNVEMMLWKTPEEATSVKIDPNFILKHEVNDEIRSDVNEEKLQEEQRSQSICGKRVCVYGAISSASTWGQTRHSRF